MFNSQERTLRESVTLALSAGWKIVRVSRTSGSSFGYMVAIPVTIPPQPEKIVDVRSFEGQTSTELIETKNKGEESEHDTRHTTSYKERKRRDDMEIIERASSRCGTPTFGSNTRLSSMQEALARFGGGMVRPKGTSLSKSTPFGGARPVPPPLLLKPALSLKKTVRKRPSPLSVPPSHRTPSPGHSPRWMTSTSPRNEHAYSNSLASPPKTITRRMSLANLRPQAVSGSLEPPPPLLNATRLYQPLTPTSPPSAVQPPILRRASHAQLSQIAAAHAQSLQSSNSGTSSPSLIPVRAGSLTESPLPLSTAGQIRSGVSLGSPAGISSHLLPPKPMIHSRRASNAQHPISQGSSRKRSGTVVGPPSRVNEESALGPSSSFLRLDSERTTRSRQSSTTSQSSLGEGGISVLDVAARIERGEFTQRTSSP